MLELERQNAYRQRYREMKPGWMPATEVYEAAIRRYLAPGMRLLDAGCGRGGIVEQLDGGGYWVAGLDPDLISLREHRLGIDRVAAWLGRTPFTRNSFDLVIGSWILEHLDHPESVLKEIVRILKPQGHFIVLTPNGAHPVSIANRMLAWAKPIQARLVPKLYGRSEQDTFPVKYRANTRRQLEQLSRVAGMQLEFFWSVPDPTYLAFNDWLFNQSCRLESRLPESSRIHIVADFVRL